MNKETMVSVPYRGATFLNFLGKIDKFLEKVSVPYRGATFLNQVVRKPGILLRFPSPIGELHFSIGYI